MREVFCTTYLRQSAFIHLVFCMLTIGVIYLFQRPTAPPMVEFRVIEAPAKLKVSKAMPLNSAPISVPIKKKPIKKKKKKAREVFGLNKNSITSSKADSVIAKRGNTVAKSVDTKKLKKGDEAALPIPQEEYLVSAMPRVISEFRVPYPDNAKKNAIEGKVVMDVLVDEKGNVRQVKLVRGPGFGLNEAAIKSMKQFKFKPAKIGERSVAVVIRYGINFVLED
jgi:periplasmic protein TonB